MKKPKRRREATLRVLHPLSLYVRRLVSRKTYPLWFHPGLYFPKLPYFNWHFYPKRVSFSKFPHIAQKESKKRKIANETCSEHRKKSNPLNPPIDFHAPPFYGRSLLWNHVGEFRYFGKKILAPPQPSQKRSEILQIPHQEDSSNTPTK